MNDFIVRQGQDEVFAEGVNHAEGQRAVLVLAVDWVQRNVPQSVVHPAHVPLQTEAQTAEVGRPRNARPARRFFGDGQDSRVLMVANLVEPLEEIDGLEVFVAAEHVGDPLAGLARVVQVNHRRHRIDAQAVNVVAVQPEQRVAEEEVAYLGTAVVENLGAPVAVFAQPRVGVLVKVCAVKVAQAMQVVGEVRGNPVEDHSEAVAMEVVDEVREVIRSAMPRGRRK